MVYIVAMNDSIGRAIKERRVVRLVYQGSGTREIEPYVLFKDHEGNVLVSAYQRAGVSKHGSVSGWKTFDVNRITSLQVSDEHFELRPDYNAANRERYPTIIAVA